MKTRILLAILMIVVALQGFGLTALADGPAGTWASGIQIQNQSDQEAHVTIEFYWAENSGNASTTPAKVHSLTIAGNQSVTLYVPSHIPGLPDNFVGSAVVSADQPVAAILNTQRVSGGGDADPKRMGSATGVLTPATKMYAPYLRKAYYGRNSYMAVQNTTGSSVNVTIKYFDHTGAQVDTDTGALTAYSSRIWYQDQNADLPADFHGSATIEATGNIAVVVNNANAGTNVNTAGFESYNGQSQGATKLYMPKLTVNYSKYQSSFTAQNVGSAPATMTFTFQKPDGTTYTKTSGTIAVGQAWAVYLATEGASGIPDLTSASGSGTLTSSQPMVGIVTETQPERGYSVIWNAIGDGTASDTILFPKFDRRYSSYNGGIQIQNVGTTATTYVATFSQPGMSGPVQVTSPTVEPGASHFWYSETVPGLPDGFNGSVVVVSTSGSDIAGVYTSSNSNRTIGDTYVAYNGIQR